MKLVREKRDRPAAAAGAAMAGAGTVVAEKVVSEEATNELANNDSGRVIWAGLDSNQRRRKASRFTVCPVWPLRYLPAWWERFTPKAFASSYILAFRRLQLASS